MSPILYIRTLHTFSSPSGPCIYAASSGSILNLWFASYARFRSPVKSALVTHSSNYFLCNANLSGLSSSSESRSSLVPWSCGDGDDAWSSKSLSCSCSVIYGCYYVRILGISTRPFPSAIFIAFLSPISSLESLFSFWVLTVFSSTF